jgi:diaminopimelate decarboxylase
MSAPALPGAPFLAREGGRAALDGHASTRWRASSARRCTSTRGARCWRRCRLPARAGRPPHLVCYAMKANSSLAVLQTFAEAGCGFDIVSAASSRACWPPAATRQGGVLRRRQDARRDAQALQAGVRCFNVESEAELERAGRGGAWRWAARAGQPARQPRRRRRHPPLHLHRPEGQQVRHRARRARWRPTGAPPRCPACRSWASTATSARRSPQVAPYLDALDRLLDLVEAVEAAGIPIHHIDVGGGLGITYTDERRRAPTRWCRRAAARIDARGHGHRELLLEPGRSLVGNAGVLLTEVLVPQAGASRRRTSASSTPR